MCMDRERDSSANAKLAMAYKELQAELLDLTQMVWVTSEIIENNLLPGEMKHVQTGGSWRVFYLTDEQVNGMMFCLTQLGRISHDLERAYRSNLETK